MSDKQITMEGPRFRPSVKVAAGVLVAVSVFALMEGASRLVYHFRDEIRAVAPVSRLLSAALVLDPYEMPSPRGGYHWVLRPGYEKTVAGLIKQKQQAGRTAGAKALRTMSTGPVIRVNGDGFKGPELDRSGARHRILAVGDSTTFGLGDVDYPRVLESALTGRGLAVEVINGGVEGYSPRNVLLEMDRYKSLEPALVVLYIGWNALYSDVPWADAWENRLRLVWLVKRAGRIAKIAFTGPETEARRLYRRPADPRPDAPAVLALGDYVPPMMAKIERIAVGFRYGGARVYLVTLPGLFTASGRPSARAIEIGHLPRFTDNPFVLGVLTERFNTALRQLAARRGFGVIDLDAWSRDAFHPRDAYFVDSVHLTPRGLRMVGTFMADRLAAPVGDLKKR